MAQKLVQYSYEYKKMKQKKQFSVLLCFLFFFVIVNIIILFFIYPVKQNSISMSPDLSNQSCVMVSPILRKYKRGDVVLLAPRQEKNNSFLRKSANLFTQFFTAQQISLYEVEEQPGTKMHLRRVVGIPGDTIYMKDYVLYVKPKGEKHFLTEFELATNPYNVTFFVPPSTWDSAIGLKGSFDEMTLEDDEYFVLSDNRKSSDDSRLWGKINKNCICAKAVLCYFPFSKFKLL